MAERKSLLLRLDPAVHRALRRWAAEDLRSVNGQIEFLLRRALREARRMKGGEGAEAEDSGEDRHTEPDPDWRRGRG